MNYRIMSMDVLRAAAILLVIVGHSVLSYGSPSNLAPLQFGGTGVDLFFVLSGWLLGGQLFKELQRTKTINIKKFWTRRWMRTLPAYYAVLFVSIAQRYLTKDNVSFPWEYLVFIQNYHNPLEFFSISWSLSVEEQFYLAIAPLLCLLASFKAVNRTIILVVLLLLPETFRILGWYEHTSETHVRWDGCIMGVLLANIRYSYDKAWEWLLGNAHYFAAITLFIYLFYFYNRWHPELGIVDPSKLILALMFGSWVIFANSNNKWLTNLYVPGANYIATRSYAMYLLHPEALALVKRLINGVPFVVYLLTAFIITMLLSEILYKFIEKPGMDLRDKLQISQK